MIHAIRLGTHAEKDYFLKAGPWFHEVVVNANLLEATAGATALLLVSLGKPYTVDPITYSFGQDPAYLMNTARGVLKRTFRSLSERFGEPLLGCVNSRRPLRPEDFSDSSEIVRFCQRVLAYQEGRVVEALHANKVFLEPGEGDDVPPVRLIAPYFYNDELRGWLAVNRQFADACVDLTGGSRLWTVVSFDGLLLDRTEHIDALAEAYESLGCAGFVFWPSGFDETRATVGQIKGLRRLVQSLCAGDRGGLMLYGGYFSALLGEEGIVGIAHGVGYGEKRDIVPVVGGGIPPAKYYLRAIHDNISINEMLRLSAEMDEATFPRDVCDCTICSGLIRRGGLQLLRSEFGATQDRPYLNDFRSVPTRRVYQLTRFHYIESKNRELSEIDKGTRDSLVEGLRESHNTFSRYLGYGRLGYLLRWQQGLTEPLD